MNKLYCEAYVEERLSKKSGNPYKVLVLVFENGYRHEIFGISNEFAFILSKKKKKK